MSHDNTGTDDAVQPLLAAFQNLEESGLPRPAAASWSEYLAALAAHHVIPEETSSRLAAAYHQRRFSRSTHDDSGLRETLDELGRAIQEFKLLDAEKRATLATAIQTQFQPTDVRRVAPAEPEAPRTAPVPVVVYEHPPELVPSDPQEILAVPNPSGSRLQRRVMAYAAGAVVLLWTLGVLASGYVAHDKIERVLANMTRADVEEHSEQRTAATDERHVARENWIPRQTFPSQNTQYDRRAVEMLFNLAREHDRKNESREAIFAYHLLLQQQPRHQLATNNLAFLLLTTDDKKLHDPVRALEMAQRVVKSDWNAPYVDTLAEAWFQNGNPVKAAVFGVQAMRARDHELHMPYLTRQIVRFSMEVWKEGFLTPTLWPNTKDAYAWLTEPRTGRRMKIEFPFGTATVPNAAQAKRPFVTNSAAQAPSAVVPPAPAE